MKTAFLTAIVCLFAAAPCRAGVVEDWNAAFLQAVRKETPPPCLVSRNLAIFHLAIHRAVQDSIKAGLGDAMQEQAAAQAADAVFRTFFPAQLPLAEKGRSQAPGKPKGIGDLTELRKIVDAAVQRTLAERENDGSSTTVHYIPKNEPGQWRRTPPALRPPEFPHWGKVKPFAIEDVTQFRAPPPPALNSQAYEQDVNEVRELGGKLSTRRTPEQTLIARFWADFSYTSSPPGHWNEIARAISSQRRLPVAEAAKLFAVLNIAMADTGIAIWDTKYHYNYWRPITAIRRADEDGLPATVSDASWESLLPSPPHPEYVSGHSGFSGAAATVLEASFGAEPVAFEAASDDVKDSKRAFTSFNACAEEIARSRVYGGIHFPAAGREGLAMGRRIAVKVLTTFRG